uniref:FERM domain-containing protein n=1 Tax=Elaeophora elaphi TaxID=1147741 RepID=A0A0R3RRI7_9BILA
MYYYHRSSQRSVLPFLDSVRYMCDNSSKNPSTSEGFRVTNQEQLPTKEQLFYVDWLTDTLVPGFLSNRKDFLKFMKLCTKDVVYDDSIFDQHSEYRLGIDKFIRRISLSKLYFSIMRAASKFEKLGSCVYENSDAVVVLWRMMTIKLYHQQTDTVEGALDIHLDKDGRIYKINNRPITRNDRKDAAVLSALKEAAKTENGEALTTAVQMRTILRYLLHFAAPSSTYFLVSRAYSNGKGGRGPEMFQLEHIRKRLEMTAPRFFRERPDYTFYRPDVVYRDEIFQVTIKGRERLMMYLGSVSVSCLFCFPHIEMEVLNILPISEDGTVRLRWRVKHVSLLRSLLNPMLFKYEYRIKKLKWFDGLTVFYVGEDGLVYRAVTRRTIDDEQKGSQTNRLADLAHKVGVLPKSAAFVTNRVRNAC